MSEVPAHWDEIGKAVTLRNQISPETLVIGNGDVESKAEALEKVAIYGVDGVMIGRGIFHNPYLFDDTKDWKSTGLPERLALLERHVRLFDETWQGKKHYPTLKKYFKIYIAGFDGASEIREKLMATESPAEAMTLLLSLR